MAVFASVHKIITKSKLSVNQLIFDTKPEVSVILCTYNRASYLPCCIDSVFAQTFTDFELIVIDDGSDDDTFNVVDPYIHLHRNIRYVKHQNRKLAFSKNIGILCSFGKYITFIDSDDTYKPNHLQERYHYLENHADIDLVQGGFYSDEAIFVRDYYKPNEIINLKDCVLGPTFFGKRQVFEQLKGFQNITYGEDTDFWARAEQQFKTAHLHDIETYIYTRAETSITKEAMGKLEKLL